MQTWTSFNDILWWISYPRMWFTPFFVMLFFPLSESDKAPDYISGDRGLLAIKPISLLAINAINLLAINSINLLAVNSINLLAINSINLLAIKASNLLVITIRRNTRHLTQQPIRRRHRPITCPPCDVISLKIVCGIFIIHFTLYRFRLSI